MIKGEKQKKNNSHECLKAFLSRRLHGVDRLISFFEASFETTSDIFALVINNYI